ncbi:16S rRNA pseudouridine(516) synthase [Endozoicomonas sp. OPT23]|uniref:pseudouridine synthase n=1 Tax=Endozoicomonas sp. OPT23 TaxID=2072845 RepID=UPI00129AF182|nr:pseudouridine synthase [Endozoicomonas sp. OPT23]MRI33142.1 16S rRNA pseudouridine(516) synthase [Endozoicomonas sp. OPT23]
MRLDRLLCQHPMWNRRHALTLLAQGKVLADGKVERDGSIDISQFVRVEVDGELIQEGQKALYIMMHKPVGILSATSDPVHKTVMDLLPAELASQLHIAGRLDRASSGLMLLTNDGQWSRRMTDPDLKKPKTYLVTTDNPIDPDTARLFAEGIYFPYEDITTSPAELEQLNSHLVRLTIYEGRYHQIKRMFGRFRNPVVGLHRESMGGIRLDDRLVEGGYRELSEIEIRG